VFVNYHFQREMAAYMRQRAQSAYAQSKASPAAVADSPETTVASSDATAASSEATAASSEATAASPTGASAVEAGPAQPDSLWKNMFSAATVATGTSGWAQYLPGFASRVKESTVNPGTIATVATNMAKPTHVV
jgi:hypothetical protein